MGKRRCSPRRSRQGGVGMIEVLVTALVLGFGLLAIAGLQLSSLRANQSSLQHSVAVMESYRIAEAARLDRNAAQSGAFDLDLDDDAPAGDDFAEQELRRWRQRLADKLGEAGTGEVRCDNAQCTVTIQWDDSRAEGDEAESVVTEVQL